MYGKVWKVLTGFLIVVSGLISRQAVYAQGEPPPEAIAACENKAAGDACSFIAPGGATITGICQTVEDVLACVPDNPPPTETPTVTPTATPTATPTSTVELSGPYAIVDTGQDTCYDASVAISCPAEDEAFYGQDAQYAGHQPNYTDNGDGTVTDSITHMMWQQSPDTDGDGDIDTHDKFTYADASTYCENLSLAGYGDWRLPDIKQLYSLIDFRGTDPIPDSSDMSGLVPFIATDYFDFAYGDTAAGERIIDAQFASSTAYVGTVMNGRDAVFGVNFADGRIKGYPQDLDFYVRCVRNAAHYGVNDFTGNGDGTITDNATGLMWTQSDSGMGFNWEDALAWVEQKNAESYLGYSDWRLPNAKELQSIVDYTRSPDTTRSAAIDPLFDTTVITNVAGEVDYPFYWSSTTHQRFDGSGTNAVYVAFGRGLGSMDGETVIDVHGAGCQRGDPKDGDPADYPSWGHGPQGDVQRVFNVVRLVRDVDTNVPPQDDYKLYLPLTLRNYAAADDPPLFVQHGAKWISDGETIWEYDYGDVAIFRAIRYPADYAGLPDLSGH